MWSWGNSSKSDQNDAVGQILMKMTEMALLAFIGAAPALLFNHSPLRATRKPKSWLVTMGSWLIRVAINAWCA